MKCKDYWLYEKALGHINPNNEDGRRKCGESRALEGKEAIRESPEADRRALADREAREQHGTTKVKKAGIRGQVDGAWEKPGGEEAPRCGALGTKW